MTLESIKECLEKIQSNLSSGRTDAEKNYEIALFGGIIRVRLAFALANLSEEQVKTYPDYSNAAFAYAFFQYPKAAPTPIEFKKWINDNAEDSNILYYSFLLVPNPGFFNYTTEKNTVASKLDQILNDVLACQALAIDDETRILIVDTLNKLSIYQFGVNNTYRYKNANRKHFFNIAYQDKNGDAAKAAILDEFKNELDNIEDNQALDDFKNKLEQDSRYRLLQTGQGITTRFLNFFCHIKTTSSERALQRMLDQKENFLKPKR